LKEPGKFGNANCPWLSYECCVTGEWGCTNFGGDSVSCSGVDTTGPYSAACYDAKCCNPLKEPGLYGNKACPYSSPVCCVTGEWGCSYLFGDSANCGGVDTTGPYSAPCPWSSIFGPILGGGGAPKIPSLVQVASTAAINPCAAPNPPPDCPDGPNDPPNDPPSHGSSGSSGSGSAGSTTLTWQSWSSPSFQVSSGTTAAQLLGQIQSPIPGYCRQSLGSTGTLSNQGLCGGSNSNIGELITIDWMQNCDQYGSFRIGFDWGYGGGMIVDGELVHVVPSNPATNWWAGNWGAVNGVFTFPERLFTTGRHTVQFVGFEWCCDGNEVIQAMVRGGSWRVVDNSFSFACTPACSAPSGSFCPNRCLQDCTPHSCPEGFFCAGGNSPPQACPCGTWSNPGASTCNLGKGFYNIAHQVNAPKFVDWAVANGANGVEMDIHFGPTGGPTVFLHGSPCDASCFAGAGPLGPQCDSSSFASVNLNYVAQHPQIALVMMDSKVDDLSPTALVSAGTQVVDLLVQELFNFNSQSFKGNVIISCAHVAQKAYIQAAINRVPSNLADRIAFGIDQMGDDSHGVLQTLVNLGTARRVFGTGISACSPATFDLGIFKARGLEDVGVSSFTYIWTLNKESSMASYLNLGARGILTNQPSTLRNLYNKLGKRLASPQERFCAASSNQVGDCDCSYTPFGGCHINIAAPPNRACNCRKFDPTKCEGRLTPCNPSQPLCAHPDKSDASCQLGGGTC